MNRYRRIASWILLVAYLPLVVMSSLHVHHETVDTKDVCSHCAGHIEDQHHHESNCQYCHFLNLSYLGQQTGQSTPIFITINDCPTDNAECTETIRYGQ
ncbi:MAG: hypothetical protein J6X59_05075 [Bacteroidales bacterium]|nr:hypothetical protein [Bacteroidales bacterium]